VEIVLGLLDHAVVGSATDGRTARFGLRPISVADLHARFVDLLGEIGAPPEVHGRPSKRKSSFDWSGFAIRLLVSTIFARLVSVPSASGWRFGPSARCRQGVRSLPWRQIPLGCDR
jgi:Family of unknown function (DUF5996)